MSRTKYLLSAIVLIALIFLAFYLKSVFDYKQAVSNIIVPNINIAKIADGTYTGACNVDFISANVTVTVQSGKITDIKLLEHKNNRGKAAEAVIGKIVREQKIDVDSVSGATNSSSVLKKAVANALENGK